MRVLVTGAGGFVGRWLIDALRARLPSPAQIYAAGHTANIDLQEEVTWLQLDITDTQQVTDAIATIRPTCVLHLAAISAVTEARRDVQHTWAVNLGGTLHLAQAVLQHAHAARFVFAGSSEVYGGTFNAQRGLPLDERALLDPTNPYAASKAAADLLLGQMARDGLQVVRFRPFNHTGPGQREKFALAAFAAQIARIERGLQEPTMRVGNLEAVRDFLDVRDVVQAYVAGALMEEGFDRGAVFNLASGVPRRIGDVLEALLSRSKTRIRVEEDPARMRANDTPIAIGSAARAREVLRWSPKRSWDSTLEDLLNHWRAMV